MLAYHNDPAVKEKYLTLVREHMRADEIVRGVGYQPGTEESPAKMCAVGCTLDAYDHSRYPIELGLPEWLARVEDKLFEGMSEEKAIAFPLDFLEAIKIGADIKKAKAPFLIMVLRSALTSFDHEKFPAVKYAIDGSIALWQRNDIGSELWKEAARATEEAAAAAWAPAWAAAAARQRKYDEFADGLIEILRKIQPEAMVSN